MHKVEYQLFVFKILGGFLRYNRKNQAFRGSAFRLHSFGTSPPWRAVVITVSSFSKNSKQSSVQGGAELGGDAPTILAALKLNGEHRMLMKYKYGEGLTSVSAIRLPTLTDEFAVRQTSRINVCAFRARIRQLPKFIFCSAAAF